MGAELEVGDEDELGASVGAGEGPLDGDSVGLRVDGDSVGPSVNAAGDSVGSLADGDPVGSPVEISVGLALGGFDGGVVACFVGDEDGAVSLTMGLGDGCRVLLVGRRLDLLGADELGAGVIGGGESSGGEEDVGKGVMASRSSPPS